VPSEKLIPATYYLPDLALKREEKEEEEKGLS